jgi:hypothetical protein
MIKLIDLLKEIDLPVDKWESYDLAKLSDDELDQIYKMYSDTYGKAGMDFSASDSAELRQKYKATYLKDVDGDHIADAFIIYKPTKYGNKIALLGTNDKREAKRDVVKKVLELVNTKGWFIEASLKMEEIMSAAGAPVIMDKKMIQDVVGADKQVDFLDDGYYTRKLSKVDKTIVKRMYGVL